MISQDVINLYDEYTHRPLSRGEFLNRLAVLVGSTAAALSVLPFLESNYTASAQTQSDSLFTERIEYQGVNGKMQAYIARPLAEKAYGTVIVIHENRGLTAHIEDVARRTAQAGFLAIAPNALAPLGVVPANEDEARTLFTQLKPEDNNQNFVKVFDYLKTRKDSNQKIGCVGFCWGGAMANYLACQVPELKAAVAFYGRQPNLADVPKIKAAVQLHYAELDTRINEGMGIYEEALKNAKIRYELHYYAGANHAFHNDTSAARYHEPSAKLAWQRTISFFEKYLV